MNLVNIIQVIVERVIKSHSFTDIAFGEVTSISPLKVKLMDSKLELNETNLVLTEGVIRKEISIHSHIHYFEKDTFKHNHGSPLTSNYPTDISIAGTAACGAGGGPITIASAKVTTTLKDGSKDTDLTHGEEDIATLENREPTKTMLEVKVNGEIIPLSKDPDGATEPDTNGTDVYWGLINNGLHKGDGVVLMRVKEGALYLILSKMYGKYEYRVDEE